MEDNNKLAHGAVGPNGEVNDFHKFAKPDDAESRYFGKKYTEETATWRKRGYILTRMTRSDDSPFGYLIITDELCLGDSEPCAWEEGDVRWMEFYYASTFDEAYHLMRNLIGERNDY